MGNILEKIAEYSNQTSLEWSRDLEVSKILQITARSWLFPSFGNSVKTAVARYTVASMEIR